MADRAGVEEIDLETIVTSSRRLGHRLPNMVVRGMDESEILAHAPAMTCDRVHWDTVEDFDARRVLPALGPQAWTRQWSDGQHRVWVPAGTGHAAREVLRQWCAEHGVEPVNMRVEPNVVFRDVSLIPEPLLPELVATTVDWLYPRAHAIRRRLVAELDLVEDQDVRPMMFLFVHDLVDRYDGGREGANGTLNFAAFAIGKLRTWPADVARTTYGRNVVTDRLTLRKAIDAIAAEGREASLVDRAAALGTSVTDLRRREHAVVALSGMRHPQSLTGGHDGDEAVDIGGDVDVEDEALAYTTGATIARAVVDAVHKPGSAARRASDPLALAAVYLSFWEGLSRPQVARELDVLPKTANAAVARVLEQVRTVAAGVL